MKLLRVYIDSNKPGQRVYQIDDKELAHEVYMDDLDYQRGVSAANEVGMKIEDIVNIEKRFKYNLGRNLQRIEGVDSLAVISFPAFDSPKYIVLKKSDIDWDEVHLQTINVFKQTFGEIEKIEIIEGSLAK